MAVINSRGYLWRQKSGRRGRAKTGVIYAHNFRDWWFVTHKDTKMKRTGIVRLGEVVLPEEYIGKKVRFKLEVVKDE